MTFSNQRFTWRCGILQFLQDLFSHLLATCNLHHLGIYECSLHPSKSTSLQKVPKSAWLAPCKLKGVKQTQKTLQFIHLKPTARQKSAIFGMSNCDKLPPNHYIFGFQWGPSSRICPHLEESVLPPFSEAPFAWFPSCKSCKLRSEKTSIRYFVWW